MFFYKQKFVLWTSLVCMQSLPPPSNAFLDPAVLKTYYGYSYVFYACGLWHYLHAGKTYIWLRPP